jgi:molybdenum ABC transporter molybdate-binding protein
MLVFPSRRQGTTNSLTAFLIASLGALVLLSVFLYRLARQKPDAAAERRLPAPLADGTDAPDGSLTLFCAAGLRQPAEKIVRDYRDEFGVAVQVQYGGSSTLLSQIEVAGAGDLYLAGDAGYTDLAHEKGLVDERLPVARMRPVLAVQKGNPKKIAGIADLLRDDVRVCLGNPGQAAIGQETRKLLKDSGQWEAVEKHVTQRGVFKPTVPEVANDVKLGAVDVGVVWDATCAQYPELEAVRTPELDRGTAEITVAVVSRAKNPTAALHFARFLAARDRGLKHFQETGYEPADGDLWADVPKLTFYAGSVNRRALAPIIKKFEEREGVVIDTVYNGCGILTAQMRTLRQDQASGFPDMYMACDVYYLDTVRDWFQDAVNVSNTDIVIVVQKGNPKGIKSLADLDKPGIRVAIGQPEQCTIGALSRRLLESEGLYEKLLEDNVVTQTASSAMLVPNITTGAADAVLAYATDTLAEAEKLDVVPIDSELAAAIQPYSIARSSDYKYLGRRLFQTIARSRESFESVGFHWRLDTPAAAADAPTGPK